jgi:hypothetical protein
MIWLLLFFIDSDAFWTSSEVLDLVACPVFWDCHWTRHKGYTKAMAFEASHWGRRRWKNLDSILCIFYFRFFSCVIWGSTMLSFNIISLPLEKKLHIAQIAQNLLKCGPFLWQQVLVNSAKRVLEVFKQSRATRWPCISQQLSYTDTALWYNRFGI